jgi:hypothetical protein
MVPANCWANGAEESGTLPIKSVHIHSDCQCKQHALSQLTQITAHTENALATHAYLPTKKENCYIHTFKLFPQKQKPWSLVQGIWVFKPSSDFHPASLRWEPRVLCDETVVRLEQSPDTSNSAKCFCNLSAIWLQCAELQVCQYSSN